MSSTNALGPLRLSGLSSGIDTDAVVKALLTTEQARVDKQKQTTTKLEWKANALREINTLMKNFRSEYLSVLSPASNMLSASAYNIYTATLLTPTSAVSISAGSSAVAGKVTINSITQLATSAKVSSTDIFTGESINTSARLEDLELKNDLLFDENGNISFSINGKDFTFSRDTTLSEMMNTINSSEAGVKMTYSSLTKGFTITTKTTGSSSRVEIQNLSGNAFDEENAAFGIAATPEPVYGQDAILTIEGRQVVRSSNTFTIDGITYTLNDESSTPISFNVQRDVESTVNKITAFIDAYNSLITTLQNKIEEKVYRDYLPLTDVQKEAMKDKEIELWEEKAKSGLLRNDMTISSLLSSLRSAFYTVVESAGISAAEIGLTTGSYGDGGKITVNKDKLRKALENNPEQVTNLFVATSKSDDKARANKESGLIVRISDALLNYTSSVTSNTLASLEKRISDSKEAEETFLDRLAARQEALYARFTAMEQALATLNSQSVWLTSLFTSSSK